MPHKKSKECAQKIACVRWLSVVGGEKTLANL